MFHSEAAFVMVAGLKAPPRDYSLLGNNTDKAFNAMGALATIAFAFNTGILPEMQVRMHMHVGLRVHKFIKDSRIEG